MTQQRFASLGLLASGLVCPCHVLAGLVTLLTGAAALSPAAQDGIHAAYVPLAVLGGALLWGRPRRVSFGRDHRSHPPAGGRASP